MQAFSVSFEGEETTAKARAGWERVYIRTHRGKAAMDGAPDRLSLGCERTTATATAEADPYGMTTKRTDDDKERTDDDKNEMRGLFAALRMTGVYVCAKDVYACPKKRGQGVLR
jgi:hypothetical protein